MCPLGRKSVRMQDGQDIDTPRPSTQEPSLVALPKHPETGLGQCVVQKEQEALSEPTGDQMQLRPLQRSGPEQRRNGFSTTGESSQQRQSCGFQSAELEENLEPSPSKALAFQRGKSSRGSCSSCDWPCAVCSWLSLTNPYSRLLSASLHSSISQSAGQGPSCQSTCGLLVLGRCPSPTAQGPVS